MSFFVFVFVFVFVTARQLRSSPFLTPDFVRLKVCMYLCMCVCVCVCVCVFGDRYGQLLESQIQTLLKDKSEETRASARFAFCTSAPLIQQHTGSRTVTFFFFVFLFFVVDNLVSCACVCVCVCMCVRVCVCVFESVLFEDSHPRSGVTICLPHCSPCFTWTTSPTPGDAQGHFIATTTRGRNA